MSRRLQRTTTLLAALLAAPALLLGEPARATATGTLTAFDLETRVLTVTSATGAVTFRVSPDARAWLGRSRLPLAQLPTHVGSQVTVSWSEVGGVRTTHTVRVSAATTQSSH